MKHIRKIIVAVLAIAVVATSAIVPAMAEGNAPQTNNGMTVTGRGGMGGPGGFGGKGGQQMPGNQQGGRGQQMPGGPQGKGQMPQNGQMPNDQQNNGQQPSQGMEPSQGQQPQDNNGQQMPGRMGKGGRGHRDMLNLDALVKDGTLSQETKDAIDTYMSEKKQTAKEDRMKSLLDELKDAGVITDEEYDAIEAAKPEQPADAPADAPAEAPAEAPADAPAEAPAEAPEAPAEQAETQE